MTNNRRIIREIKFTRNGFEGGSLMFFQTLNFFQPKSNLNLGCRVDVKCSIFLGLSIFGVSPAIINNFGKKQTQAGNLGSVYLPLAFLDSR